MLSCLLLVLLLTSCSYTKVVKKELPFDYCNREIILTRDIIKGKTAAAPPAADTTTIFLSDSDDAIAYLKCQNLSGEHKIRWEWYDPKGKLYLSTGDQPLSASEGKYLKEINTWHRLSIPGEKAAGYTGDWQVKVYFDNNLLASKGFKIESGEDIDRLPASAHKPNPKNWGLIIGIEKYAFLPSVDYAGKDALTMKEYMMKILGIPEENIILLSDSKATKSQIEGHLKGYLPTNVEKETNLYIYFAGHGLPDIEKGNAYLVPYDGDTRFITQTGYKLNDFYEDLNKLNIQRTYVFLDACFSGTQARGEKMLLAGARPALIHIEDIKFHSDKIIFLNASEGAQISSSYPEKQHGLFTYFLLSGLRGKADTNKDGSITIEELYNHVKENVIKFSRRKGIEQTPSLNPSFKDIAGIKGISINRMVK
ncbi:MAG: caspase family protein [Nitrospirae bacterium]|nr:caspase family protein [Nitrospirota bacterium]